MTQVRLTALTLLALLYSATPPAAFAEKDGHHGKGHKARHYDDDDRDVIIINRTNRPVIRQYIVTDYRSNCPPGLAKKHNGCMPPGHAKKHYVVGRPLPAYVAWREVPEPLLVQLEPVPVGYQYVMVDQDVLLMNAASHKVIDAVTLLSAVGR